MLERGVAHKVLLLDGYSTRTLACVRSFGRAGVAFAVGGHTRWDMSLHSRHARETFVYSSPFVDLAQFAADVTRHARRLNATAILPTSEAAILACSAHRERLPVPLLAPPPAQLELLFCKPRMLALAGDAGLGVPRTVVVPAAGQRPPALEAVPLPAVVKAGRSEVLGQQRVTRTGDTIYVRTRAQLDRALERTLVLAPEALVQPFVDGHAVGVSGVFSRGEAVVLFAHRRLRESTPTGGPGAVVQSIPLEPDLEAATRRLMRATGTTGPAMVEYKVERRTGEPHLMEVNGRLWGSILLPLAAGLDLPLILLKVWSGQPVVEAERRYRVGVVGRHLVGDTKHLLLALRGRPAGWTGPFPGRWQALGGYLGAFFSGEAQTLVLTADDPLPFFSRLLQQVAG
jgi:predicted ATP-grasp superfamily ATP-dependent carboligase